ncbi:MAG: hypothetical protein J6S73_02815 [Lentisphaeria bacterium]|nr:hypothetical protein [Lentisphaeria bacterium]
MTPPISTCYNWKKLTPDDGHYFFGYYDRNPWNPEKTLHLAMKVPQITRLPERGETAEIGLVDKSGNYTPVTTTRTWCHQQGCMELFLPHRPGCFCYNDYDESSGKIIARIYEIGKGVVGSYPLPIYAMSPDGNRAVSLNFSRIPRRGYSYADAVLAPDPHPSDPDAEGLWLMDLHTGKAKLIVSYRKMMELHPYGYALNDQYIWLNHAIFNCDSSRLLWLFRQCPEELKYKPKWETYLYTCALDGSDAECVLSQSQWRDYISHQIWGRTPREILVDASWGGAGHDAIVFDESRRPWIAERLSRSHGAMAHMIFSPDGKTILADSYPDEDSNQKLIRIDAATGNWELLGTFHHEATPIGETRCDLHPRWSPDGAMVTVDSTHDGKRGIYLLEL